MGEKAVDDVGDFGFVGGESKALKFPPMAKFSEAAFSFEGEDSLRLPSAAARSATEVGRPSRAAFADALANSALAVAWAAAAVARAASASA
jgi:hypothetical protein